MAGMTWIKQKRKGVGQLYVVYTDGRSKDRGVGV